MNRCIQRGLRTVLLTGGFLAVGAGVAAADENDLTADLLGVTATVPVADDAVVQTPVVTGHGGNTTVGSDTDDGIALPVNTDTAPGTTAFGPDGSGGIGAPVRVTEATDDPPTPEDGLSVTVPVNTSGGGAAGTTVTVPIITGTLGGVLDGDPLSGNDVDVDLDGPLVLGSDGSGLLLDLEDTVTIGKTDGETAPRTVLEVPASLEANRPTTVTLPLGDGDATTGPVSGNDVDVHVGRLFGDGEPPTAQEPTDDDAGFTLPVDTGNLLSGAAGGDAVTGNTVDVHLGDLLGADGSGTGSMIAVPVNENGSGTGSDNLVRVTLPIDLAGLLGPGDAPDTGDGDGTGSGDGDGSGDSGHPGNGTGDGSSYGDDYGNADCFGPSHGAGPGDGDRSSHGTASDSDGGPASAGSDSRDAIPGSEGGAYCGVGDAESLLTQSASTEQSPTAVAAMAGLIALSIGVLSALGRRLTADRS